MIKQLPHRWPFGSGAMADLVRRHNWGLTPLGPIDAWPERLKVAVDICLGSAMPTFIWWGPDLIQLYNDAAVEILQVKHPQALGRPAREAWSDVWPAVGPLVERVMGTGEAVRVDDILLQPDRGHGAEDAYFTATYGALRSGDGRTAGIYISAIETTARHLADAARKASEQALRDREERLQIALDAADLGTWDLDLTTDRATVRSLRHDRMFGYTEPQAEWGQQIAERHVLPEDVPVFRDAFARAAQTGVLQCEVRVRWPDGSVRWIAPQGRTYYDEAGKPIRMAGVVADITERKQSDERLGLIVQIARDYAIFTTDPEGCITEWLPGAAAVFGWKMNEALGQSAAMLYTAGDRAAGIPDQEFAAAREQGRAPDVRWHLRRDGSRVFIEGSNIALHDADGRLRGFLKIGQDITERVRAEEALRDSKRRLDVVLENASVAIILMDEHQQCVYMNSATERLTGYTLAETRNRSIHDLWHHTRPDGSRYPKEQCPIAHALGLGSRTQGEEVLVHKDGSFYPVAFTASPIPDDDGRLIGTVIELRDIRREKETLEALREADRRKDEFLAMLAHELRNPLAPIVNAVRLLDRIEPMSEAGQRSVAMIERQTRQMKRLIDDLLEVSRISRGKIDLKVEPMSIGSAIYSAADSVGALAAQRNQRVEVALPVTPVRIVADPVRVAQILENLLHNASKYTPEGGLIRVELDERPGEVEISVIDNGIGIASDQISHLFEMFRQIDTTLDRAQGGLGIGLAMVKRLVELHGGSVSAASEGPGKGSTFRVRLPRGGDSAGWR